MMMKRCTKCGEEKPTTDFYNHKKSRDGLQHRCKVCCKKHNDQYFKKWYYANPGKVQARRLLQRDLYASAIDVSQKRRSARKKELPNTFNNDDWLLCLEDWHYCCAVCGKQLRDLLGNIKPNADHWIPLNYKGADNPGTVPENMICLCNNCNSSKCDKMPEAWLVECFGKRKADKILDRIEFYFQVVREEQRILKATDRFIDALHVRILGLFEPEIQVLKGKLTSKECILLYEKHLSVPEIKEIIERLEV